MIHDYMEISLNILIVLVVLTIGVLFTDRAYERIKTLESCEPLNMKYKQMELGEVCIDNNNQAHFVDIECDGILWEKQCTATIINVGDFRVR